MDNCNNNMQDMTLIVSPKSPDTRWVALDNNDVIISEGKTPTEAIEEAKRVAGDEYTLMFVPIEGNTCFY